MKAKVALLLSIVGVGIPLTFISTQLNLEAGVISFAPIAAVTEIQQLVDADVHRYSKTIDAKASRNGRIRSSMSSNHVRRKSNHVRRQFDNHQSDPTTGRYKASRPPPNDPSEASRVSVASAEVDQVLEFVHITKTGGTAVEKAGGEAGLKWGGCHCRVGAGPGCQHPDWTINITLRSNISIPGYLGEEWHTPPSWFENSPYKGKKTFTVVRNPYDRVVSEFYCEFFGYYKDQQHIRNNSHLIGRNESLTLRPFRLQKKLRDALALKGNESLLETNSSITLHVNGSSSEKKNMTKPLRPPTLNTFNIWIRHAVRSAFPYSGHMIPQHSYVYDNINGSVHKFVDHVLKYENLQHEFSVLMKQYGLCVKLSHRSSKSHSLDHGGNPKFTVADLDARSVCLINKCYAQDFEMFGYPMIIHPHCEEIIANETCFRMPKKGSNSTIKTSSPKKITTKKTKAATYESARSDVDLSADDDQNA